MCWWMKIISHSPLWTTALLCPLCALNNVCVRSTTHCWVSFFTQAEWRDHLRWWSLTKPFPHVWCSWCWCRDISYAGETSWSFHSCDNTPWHGVKTEEEPLCILGGAFLQFSHIVCFQDQLSLLISGTSFSSFRLGGLGLVLTPTSPTHKGSSFPVQLNPCLTVCFLQFLFGPWFSLVSTWRAQPWPLPAALTCVLALWDGSPHVQPSLLCRLGDPSSYHGGPHNASSDGELFLPGASFPWCL